MKNILFLLFIFPSILLQANDALDDFINQQIKIESQLLDQNLSIDKKMDIKKNQEAAYQKFFLNYAADKEAYIQKADPYKHVMNKLKLRIESNKYRDNTNAVMRDEVLLKDYNIRKGIRDTFHHILLQTQSESKAFFKDKINETIVNAFSKYTALDKRKYIPQNPDPSSPVIIALHKALKNLNYLEYVINTFSSEVVENSDIIYRAGRFSNLPFFTLIKAIDTSSFGQKLNPYITYLHLDTAKVLLILAIIILLLIIHSFTRFMINRFLIHHHLQKEEIDYIHAHITNLFKILTTVLIVHLMLVSYLGFDSKSINISKVFAILYVIIVTLLLYRITNTIAYYKMESINKSKMLKNEVINLSIKVINSLVILMALVAILKIVGIDLTALLSGLGIAGAAVAFAAKDSIANIFGSISILAGDVFEQGDWIETSSASGTVVEIGLRATTIRTFDNALISIPNFELVNKGIKNWSRRRIGRRIKMNIGVTYQSSFKDIHQAIEDIRAMLKEHPGIANERTSYQNSERYAKLVSLEDFKGIKRTTLVYMDSFAESSINILVYCFSRSVDWGEWLEVKEDVMYKIADILAKNNLDFAFPTLTLHQAEELPTIGD